MSGILEMNGWAEFRATPIGVLPIREYCWYRDSRLLTCSTQPSLALRHLTLSDEGLYYVVAHTDTDSVQSENLVFEIYGELCIQMCTLSNLQYYTYVRTCTY